MSTAEAARVEVISDLDSQAEPMFADRMAQVVHAAFPALTCIAVGVLMERRWRRNARNATGPPAGRSFEG